MITTPQFESQPPGGYSLGPEADALAQQLQQAHDDAQAAASKEEDRKKDLHTNLYRFFKEEQERQAANRFQMALDEDYFDSLQWSDDEIRKLTERNQAALVYNAIKPMVLWVMGTEKRTRIDYSVLPRKGEDGAQDSADQKTKLLKYLDDVNKSPFATSQAFKESVISGLSWLEDGATNNPQEMPLYAGWESWKNCLHDTAGGDFFGKDWRYFFRWRELDQDVATAMFPNDAAHIETQCTEFGKPLSDESGWYLGMKRDSVDWPNPATSGIGRRNFIDLSQVYKTQRRRLRLIEAWYRIPTQCYVCKGQVYDGQTYDPQHDGMKTAADQGAITIVNQVVFQMRVAFMTDQKILEDRVSPYKHNDFPFTPLWCYRRGRDGAPYGVVREMRDPQDSLNKHMSKAQWHLAANQIIAGKDVVTDWKKVRRNADKANGTIILDGPNSNGRFEINRGTDKAGQHVEMAKFDMSLMRENYGLNTDNFGIQSNAQSGRAIHARQEQGSVQTQSIFDNLRLMHQIRGEKRLSLIEQFMTEEMVFRTTGEKRGQYDYIAVNKPFQDEDGNWRFENDITAREDDFIVDAQDYSATIRQAMAATLADMIAKMPPEVAFKFMDMWVDLTDIPNKDEYLKRVRQLNGMADDSDPVKQAQDQANQQAQQQVQKIQQQAGQQTQALQSQIEATTSTNATLRNTNLILRGALDKKVQLLANKAEELRLRKIQIDNEHAENMTALELQWEKQRQSAADSAAQAQAQQQAGFAKRQVQTAHDASSKVLQEMIANVEQMMAEFQQAQGDATQ